MVLPTFLVVGAMKAGTTSLHEQLRSRPDVFLPRLKEIEFFSEPRHWARGLDWYAALFADGAGAAARGEASTGYTKFPRFPEVPARIAATLPDVRLVYLVRDPVERMRSHYEHNVLQGLERQPIEVAFGPVGNYAAVSRYATQIERYLDVLPREQLLVVAAEDLRDDPASVLGRVLRHIGASDRIDDAAPVAHHVTVGRRQLRPGLAWLRRTPWYVAARRAAPPMAQRLAGRLLGRTAPPAVAVPEALRRRVLDEMGGELDRLAIILGGLPTSWNLD